MVENETFNLAASGAPPNNQPYMLSKQRARSTAEDHARGTTRKIHWGNTKQPKLSGKHFGGRCTQGAAGAISKAPPATKIVCPQDLSLQLERALPAVKPSGTKEGNGFRKRPISPTVLHLCNSLLEEFLSQEVNNLSAAKPGLTKLRMSGLDASFHCGDAGVEGIEKFLHHETAVTRGRDGFQ